VVYLQIILNKTNLKIAFSIRSQPTNLAVLQFSTKLNLQQGYSVDNKQHKILFLEELLKQVVKVYLVNRLSPHQLPNLQVYSDNLHNHKIPYLGTIANLLIPYSEEISKQVYSVNRLNKIPCLVERLNQSDQVYLEVLSQLRILFFNKILQEMCMVCLKLSKINNKILNRIYLYQISIKNLQMILLDFLIVF
jgi:hypothetical protein